MIKWRPQTITGSPSQMESLREYQGRILARRAAAEGIALLKNEDSLLPLQPGRQIALFGSGAGRTIKGGTGSGDVNERSSVTVRQGLENAGFYISTGRWLEEYDRLYDAARQEWKHLILDQVEQDPDHDIFIAYSANPFRIPAGEAPELSEAERAVTDTAVYVISRVAGENKDRICGEGDWLLSEEEKRNLRITAACFPHVVLVINAGGPVDLSILEELPQIQAVLFMGQAGMEGGNALGQVLSGEVNPSGHLSATWAYSYEDYPNARSFSYLSGSVTREDYVEGIYVGYRYFDTFDQPVRYPFGWGLSYTDFRMEAGAPAAEAGTVSLPVTVTNLGSRAGKAVAQLYAACPQGKLVKEKRRLAAFEKTKLLAPGEQQELVLSFPVEYLASYCDECSGFVLEQGEYGLFLGENAGDTKLVGGLHLAESALIRKAEPVCPIREELEEISPDPEKLKAWSLSWQSRLGDLPAAEMQAAAFEPPVITVHDPMAEEIAAKLDREQLVAMAMGNPSKGHGSNLGSAGSSVPGSAGETASGTVDGFSWPGLVMADGPAGLRLSKDYRLDENGNPRREGLFAAFENGFFQDHVEITEELTYHQYCTAYPVGVLLAQSWDKGLMEEVGRSVGVEMEEFSVTLWLAPGMNIQRNPLCGRNFEYYSEDPLLSGQIAASITKGVQSIPGVGTTIKHFACNNQEDNRFGSDSVISQRALREIYLRGFEIAVKTSQPMAIMTSYNLINGVHTANSYDLCTRLAREEWGFQGLIMTDWATTNEAGGSVPHRCALAGNDLIMPGLPCDREDILRALEEGSLTEEDLRKGAAHILNIVLQSNQRLDAVPYLHL